MTLLVLFVLAQNDPKLTRPGNHELQMKVDGRTRTYLVHVPPKYDPKKPTPVVLIFHGAMANAAITVLFTGLSEKADAAGFIAVYPNGTGRATGNTLLTWNAGNIKGLLGVFQPNDLAFVRRLLDELPSQVNVDRKRIFATGMSNGAMMCYHVAAAMPDRIAAIAPVAGTMTADSVKLARPVPVMHFHGVKDMLVPFAGPHPKTPDIISFKSVNETMQLWAKANGCPATPKVMPEPPRPGQAGKVTRTTYGPGKDGAEVVMFTIDGAGHTWPGRKCPVKFLGGSTLAIAANDLMWDFFERHPLK